MRNFPLNIKYLFILTIVFILFVPIGTVSHEFGHIAAAKYLGYETHLHYGSMNYYPQGYMQDKDVLAVTALTKNYRDADLKTWPDDIREKAEAYWFRIEEKYFNTNSNGITNDTYIFMGGPLQSMLTGVIGLLIIFQRRKSIRSRGLAMLDWLAVFLGLFWVREIFNLLMSIANEMISPDGSWFSGDEYYISRDLNLWAGTIPIILGTMGGLISLYIVFKVVPKNLRPTFLLSGLIGGTSGFILWMFIVGPVVLPK